MQDWPHVFTASPLPPQEYTEIKRLSNLFSYFPASKVPLSSSLWHLLPFLRSAKKLASCKLRKWDFSQTTDRIQAFI